MDVCSKLNSYDIIEIDELNFRTENQLENSATLLFDLFVLKPWKDGRLKGCDFDPTPAGVAVVVYR